MNSHEERTVNLKNARIPIWSWIDVFYIDCRVANHTSSAVHAARAYTWHYAIDRSFTEAKIINSAALILQQPYFSVNH